LEGLLIGSIVSSTDAAAVFAVLRSRNVSLRGQLKPLLELESGSNDPMAVFLTLGLIGLLTGSTASVLDLFPQFVLQMTLGAALGYGIGTAMAWLVNRLHLEYDGLYPVLTLSLVLFAYSATASVGGNGFLAVYVAGIIMGNSEFSHKRSLMQFHDGLAWLMQIVMFLTLGLQVFPSQLVPVASAGLLLSLFLMLCARPIAVFATLSFARIGLREKLLVAWVGLRGAVPIILATFPLVAGVQQASMIFNVVFFIVLSSVLLQGTSIPLVARWLKVDAPFAADLSAGAPDFPAARSHTSALMEFRIPPTSGAIGMRLSDLNLPSGALVILVGRRGYSFAPVVSTRLEANDTLMVCADRTLAGKVSTVLGAPQPVPRDDRVLRTSNRVEA
jgi:cell volume regulation protein A